MLSQETLQRLLQSDVDRLARKEPNGRRLRALAHLKEGKNWTEVADALWVTRHAVMRWVKWLSHGGTARRAGMPHAWHTQRLPHAQQAAFITRTQSHRTGMAAIA